MTSYQMMTAAAPGIGGNPVRPCRVDGPTRRGYDIDANCPVHQVPFGVSTMLRTLLVLAAGTALGAGGLALSHDEKHDAGEIKRKVIAEKDIVEKLDGKEAKVTVLEVTLEPGQA